MPILRALGSTGVVAIYDGPDDAPFTAPLDHLANGRLKFHSSLAYPKVIAEHTVTLSLPSRGSIGTHRVSYDLLPHGRPGIPWVLASLRVGGQDVAAVGSVPVQKAGNSSSSPWARWISIGAIGSQVTAFEYTAVPLGTSAYTFSSISIPVTVWITDELF